MNGYDIKKIRSDFPMLNPNKKMQGKPLVWLDNASTTFKPKQVIDAINYYYTDATSNSHRGDYDLCFAMDKVVMETREVVASFINSKKTEIVFTSGTTASINLVAYGYAMKYLKEGDEILLTEAEHASNVLPWYKVKEVKGCNIGFIPLDEDGRLSVENVKASINEKTKIIAIAQVTNVLGFVTPIKEIAKLCHEKGIILVVDGAQSVPHMKMDVKDLDCDFLSFSGHKLCGPTGIGVLYGKYELLEKMDPFMSGGGNNVKFDMCGDASFLEPPMRFEAGTQNLEGIIGLKAAIEYISALESGSFEAAMVRLGRLTRSTGFTNSASALFAG